MRRCCVFTGCIYTGTYSLISALTAPLQVEAGVSSHKAGQERNKVAPRVRQKVLDKLCSICHTT